MSKKTVAVGLSGGVDSAVTAFLLKEMGYDVVGLFMKNWEEEIDGVCTTQQDFEDVVKVATAIDIPYYSISFAKEYKERVFSHFLKELAKGNTPNPDILCNREIKFNLLLNAAKNLGAELLATGHYAINDGNLKKSVDLGKDQTYFLYTINKTILQDVLFPLGSLQKPEVRAIAKKANLAVHEKKDSTGICFIGERNFSKFLSGYLQYQPGNFCMLDGKVVGVHQGVSYYTIGQRRGLGIGGPGDAYFVVGKDVEKNIVFVAQGANHPALFSDTLTATELSWVGDAPPIGVELSSKIRYRQPDQPCIIEKIDGDTLFVRFLVPQRAITPQQSIVFYNGDICLGGAVISARGNSYHELQKSLPA